MLLLNVALATILTISPPSKIDREALVSRHNVVQQWYGPNSPVQVGNGEFAFGMDITGLQTFTPFNTMSHWGWHSGPIPAGTDPKDFKGQVWETHGRPVRYPMPDPDQPALSSWMASNPHRINLGRIGLRFFKEDGSPALPSDITDATQTLDLWGGVVTSYYKFDGHQVMVKTAVTPDTDTVAVIVHSPLIAEGRLRAFVACPGDNPTYFANYVGDWGNPARLQISADERVNHAVLTRTIEGGGHHIGLRWTGSARLERSQDTSSNVQVLEAKYGTGDQWADVTDDVASKVTVGGLSMRVTGFPDPAPGKPKNLRVTYLAGNTAQIIETNENQQLTISPRHEHNRVEIVPQGRELVFTATFSAEKPTSVLPDGWKAFEQSRAAWKEYWQSGGAIDLSESTDPRWKELERRIVLSQYLMRVNEAGSYPPQESGLVNNGWYGRFHMEMVWWHGTHWALWNRWPMLERYLGIYQDILPNAQALAASQGYKGARWPKCIGPDGREWPDQIHALLAWQQPHPIFFAELEYRARPTRTTLEKWWPIIKDTADFMATYAVLDPATGKHVLGPPIVPVSENTDPRVTKNPAFELGYWRYGLRTANEWRSRMGMPHDAQWKRVYDNLSPIPQKEGLYVLHDSVEDMWTRFAFEHPAMTGTYGLLPGDGVDKATMGRTVDKIAEVWNFNHVWGWDFPMLAMAATRLGRPEQALDFLLHESPNFQYDERGLASGGPFPYFPANGGLLYTVAMMAGGWDGAPNRPAPGFPNDGSWKVKVEKISPAP